MFTNNTYVFWSLETLKIITLKGCLKLPEPQVFNENLKDLIMQIKGCLNDDEWDCDKGTIPNKIKGILKKILDETVGFYKESLLTKELVSTKSEKPGIGENETVFFLIAFLFKKGYLPSKNKFQKVLMSKELRRDFSKEKVQRNVRDFFNHINRLE